MTIAVESLKSLSIFDQIAVKRVTRNDVEKGAYVLTKGQVRVLSAAGRTPLHDDQFIVKIAFDAGRSSVEASYYESVRSVRASRRPEPRMGREIISSWMTLGDSVAIANIGPDLFAFKMSECPADTEEFISSIAALVPAQVAARAAVDRPAERHMAQRTFYVRNPWVVAAAILRANGSCEMPDCNEALIIRDDGRPYLEVHHIDPLGNGGADDLMNVAALCPRCHRFLHHGQGRESASERLLEAIGRTLA